GDHGVDRQLVDELRQAGIAGIEDIQPLVIGRVTLPDLENRTALLLGFDPPAEQRVASPWGIEVKPTNPLALFSGLKPVFLGSQLAKQLPEDSSAIRVRCASRVQQLAVAGTVDAQGPAATLGGNVLFLRLGDAADLLGRQGYVSRIDLSLDRDTDRDQIR